MPGPVEAIRLSSTRCDTACVRSAHRPDIACYPPSGMNGQQACVSDLRRLAFGSPKRTNDTPDRLENEQP